MQLVVENLSVSYGNIKALHGISFSVEQGEIVTIIGANGAGKSTLVSRMISEYRSRQSRVGVIAVDPSSPFTGSPRKGVRFQERQSPGCQLS